MKYFAFLVGTVTTFSVLAMEDSGIREFPATPETVQQCVRDFNTRGQIQSTFFDFLVHEQSDHHQIVQWCQELRSLFQTCRHDSKTTGGYICSWVKGKTKDILQYGVSKVYQPTFILSSAHKACLGNLNERCGVFESLVKHQELSEKLQTALQSRKTHNQSWHFAKTFQNCRQLALNTKRSTKDRDLKHLATNLMSTCSTIFRFIREHQLTNVKQLKNYEPFHQYQLLWQEFQRLKSGGQRPLKSPSNVPTTSNIEQDDEALLEEEYQKLLAEEGLKMPSSSSNTPPKIKVDNLENELEQLMKEEGLQSEIPQPPRDEDQDLEDELERLMQDEDDSSK